MFKIKARPSLLTSIVLFKKNNYRFAGRLTPVDRVDVHAKHVKIPSRNASSIN